MEARRFFVAMHLLAPARPPPSSSLLLSLSSSHPRDMTRAGAMKAPPPPLAFPPPLPAVPGPDVITAPVVCRATRGDGPVGLWPRLPRSAAVVRRE